MAEIHATETFVSDFDYSGVDRATVKQAKALATRVRAFERVTMDQMIELGDQLTDIKAELGHGRFGDWLAAEFGDKIRSAQRYMLAAAAFTEKRHVTHLLSASAIHALAAAPAQVRNEIVTEIETAGDVPLFVIKRRVSEAKAEARQAEKLAKLSPEERKKAAQAEKRQRRTAKQAEAERLARNAESDREMLARHEAAEEAAQAIIAGLGRERAAEVEALIHAARWVFAEALAENLGADRRSAGMGHVRELARLRWLVPNRERIARGEPELPRPDLEEHMRRHEAAIASAAEKAR